MQALLDVIAPVFLVVGFGYVLTWRNVISETAIDNLMTFAQQIAVPCLLFNAMVHIELGAAFNPQFLMSFYVGAFTCFWLGLLGALYLFNRSFEDSVAIGFCALFSNSVLLGLALTERAYGPAALENNYAIVALHAPFCYGLGITMMEFAKARATGTPPSELPATVLRAMLGNVLIVAIFAGLLLNLSGVALPNFMQGGLDLIVRAALPTALFAMGGILYRYRPEGDVKVILFVCALALLVHPSITFTLGNWSNLPDDAMRSAVLTSAMAPGVNVYIFANMYGRARRVAASSALLATVLSIGTAWVWLEVLP